MLVKKTNMIVTTRGKKGALIETEGKKFDIPAAQPKNESDPTGAGDAFRAGFLAGFMRDYSLENCGKMGAVTAVYTVEKYGTQTHLFTKKEFVKRYKENYPEDARFDF